MSEQRYILELRATKKKNKKWFFKKTKEKLKYFDEIKHTVGYKRLYISDPYVFLEDGKLKIKTLIVDDDKEAISFSTLREAHGFMKVLNDQSPVRYLYDLLLVTEDGYHKIQN